MLRVLARGMGPLSEVFSASGVTVLGVVSTKGRPCDLADLAGTDGDVLQSAPPTGEQGEAALAQAAQ